MQYEENWPASDLASGRPLEKTQRTPNLAGMELALALGPGGRPAADPKQTRKSAWRSLGGAGLPVGLMPRPSAFLRAGKCRSRVKTALLGPGR